MRRFAVLGSPIGHSKSPAMQNAAFRALGLDSHRYEAIDTRPDALEHRLEELRRGTLWGANLTVPLKRQAVALCDELSPTAARIGAVNTIARGGDGVLLGHNTDAPGLVLGLAALGIELPGRGRALVLGGGGAARAIVAALLDAGLSIAWVSRRPDRLPAWANTRGWAWEGLRALEPVTYDVVVNATTVGMAQGPAAFPVAIDAAALERWGRPVVVDAVYPAPPGGLVAQAARAGLRAADGLPMLWGQGVLALETWLAIRLPAAARRAMARAIGFENLAETYM